MKREEILKKAQSDQIDEMEMQAKDKSLMWSYVVMVVASAVFTLCRSGSISGFGAAVCFSVFAGMMYRFVKTREWFYFILAVVTLISAIFATIRFIMGH